MIYNYYHPSKIFPFFLALFCRYYLRMVIRGADADDTKHYDCDIRWCTTEIVLYRSQHPCHHVNTEATTTLPPLSSSSQA